MKVGEEAPHSCPLGTGNSVFLLLMLTNSKDKDARVCREWSSVSTHIQATSSETQSFYGDLRETLWLPGLCHSCPTLLSGHTRGRCSIDVHSLIQCILVPRGPQQAPLGGTLPGSSTVWVRGRIISCKRRNQGEKAAQALGAHACA